MKVCPTLVFPTVPCQHPSSSQQLSSVCVCPQQSSAPRGPGAWRTAGSAIILQSPYPLSSNAEGVLLHRNVVAVSLFHVIWRGDLGRLLITTLPSNVFSYLESLWSLCKMFSMTLKRMCVQQFCSAVSNKDITPNVGLSYVAPHSCMLTCSAN